MKKLTAKPIIPCLLVILLGSTLLNSLKQTSVTVDEFAHLPAGLTYWKSGSFSAYRHNPPLLRLLAAAPLSRKEIDTSSLVGTNNRWQLGLKFMNQQRENYHTLFMSARTVIIALTCITALLLFFATYRSLGYWPGVVAMTLFSFSPTVLAHGGLVTTDAGFSLAFFSACFSGALFLKRPSWRRAMVFGTVLGMAQLTKFTALLLYPTLLVVVLTLPYMRRLHAENAEVGFLKLGWNQRVGRLSVILLISLLILNAGYLFQGFGDPFHSYPLKHPWLDSLANTSIGHLPSPLPADFVMGFDDQYREASGRFSVYLLGELSTSGWWYYYPLAMSLKLPLPLFLMLAAVIAAVVKRKLPLQPLILGCLFVPAFGLLFFMLFTNIDLGIRYLLFLLPLMYMAVAHLATRAILTKRMKAFLILCLAWYCLSSALSYPHYLSYFSEISGGPSQGHRFLADSNLDWGQDLIHLRRIMRRRGITSVALSHFGLVDPAVYGIRYEPLSDLPTSNTVVISINHLLGIHPFKRLPNLDRFRRKAPSEVIGHSLWLFDREPPSPGAPHTLDGTPPESPR